MAQFKDLPRTELLAGLTFLINFGNMEQTQAKIELAVRQIAHVEAKISERRATIARIRELGFPTEGEEEELAALLRALEVLKVHLGQLTAPDRSEKFSA